jgi:DNA-binding CsgD family transcriptional regulator
VPLSSTNSAVPLVGRTVELERIAAVRAAGDRPGVVIAASAGVGKSRLAREAVAAARVDGALVEWIQATRSAAAVPLGAFAGVIPDDARSDEPLTLMRQCLASLRERSEGRPVVLGVDDMHSLDVASAALVLQLATTRTAFVIGTLRTGEPAPDAVEALWKDAGVLRLRLAPLDEAETTRLMEEVLGGPAEQRASRWLFDHSRGNALFARELIAGALAGGSLARVRGFWRMTGLPPVSDSLGDLVAARVGALGDAERRAVELLAIGEPLPLGVVVALTDSATLARAEAEQLVVLDGHRDDDKVRLAHPIYGDVVRTAVPVAWARELRKQLAEHFQVRGSLAADDTLRVARWLLDAGEPVPVGLLVDASDAAIRAGDPTLGAELAALALDGGAGAPAALLLVRAHLARKQFDEALVVLEGAQALIDEPSVALEFLDMYAMTLYWGLRRADEVQALLERAESWWPDASWRQALYPLRLWALEPPFDVTLGERMLAEPDLDPEVRRKVEALQIDQLFYAGRVMEALDLATRLVAGVALSRRDGDYALSGWTWVAFESGADWAALDGDLSEMIQEAVRDGDGRAIGLAAFALGTLRAAAGQLLEATRWLAEAELQFERQDVMGSLCATRACQVEVLVHRGELDAVEPALARCLEVLDGAEPTPGQLPYVIRARAWARHALGDDLAAQRLLLEGAEQLAPMPFHAAQLGYEAVRVGVVPSVALRVIRPAAAACDAPLTAACAVDIEARAARDGAAVLSASERLEELGAIVFAWEAAAHAAMLFADEGRTDSARRAAARATALHARGTGVQPLVVVGVDPDEVALTRRESQLVELARQGLSNADIAERLVVSVRTVESHLYKAMKKLGVTDRREL